MKLIRNFAAAILVILGSLATAHAGISAKADWKDLPDDGIIRCKGNYRLNQDIHSDKESGSIIEIRHSDVVLDFAGHSISGMPKTSKFSLYGVSAIDRDNVHIYHGRISNCYYGILLGVQHDSTPKNSGHHVDRMVIESCFGAGIMLDHAKSSSLSNNTIRGISDSAINPEADGIDAFHGGQNSATGNTISDISVHNDKGAACGITSTGTLTADHNVIQRISKDVGFNNSFGILDATTAYANRISSSYYGLGTVVTHCRNRFAHCVEAYDRMMKSQDGQCR